MKEASVPIAKNNLTDCSGVSQELGVHFHPQKFQFVETSAKISKLGTEISTFVNNIKCFIVHTPDHLYSLVNIMLGDHG